MKLDVRLGLVGVGVLYRLGYRVVHLKNIVLAQDILKRIASGNAVLNDDIMRALSALDYAPLSQSDVIVLGGEHDDNAESTEGEKEDIRGVGAAQNDPAS